MDPRKAQALESIGAIASVLEASHRIAFPGRTLMLYGALILLIPPVEKATAYLTFGNAALLEQPVVFGLIHVVVYWGLFKLAAHAMTRFGFAEPPGAVHPLIRSFIGTQKTVEAGIAAMILMMCALGKPEAIFPLAFLFLAILFQFYGRFTQGPLKFASWLLLLAGLAYGGLLTKYDAEMLWFVFSGFLGLVCLVAGWKLHREAKRPSDSWNSS